MSNERHTSDTDGERDDRVSRAYRDLATERVPERLNAAVLQTAAKAARPAYKRSVLWTRPVAWAAVVAICLAITLQVTQVPVPSEIPELEALRRDDQAASPDSSPAAPPAAKAEQEQTLPAEQTPEPAAGDMPVRRQGEDRSALSSPAVEPDRSRAAPVATSLEEAAAPLPEDFAIQEADMLRRAEDMVRLREGDNKEAAAGVAALAPAGAATSSEVAGCSDDDREDPEAWLLCIVRLERAGSSDAAASEREQLSAAFPDFELPAKTE